MNYKHFEITNNNPYAKFIKFKGNQDLFFLVIGTTEEGLSKFKYSIEQTLTFKPDLEPKETEMTELSSNSGQVFLIVLVGLVLGGALGYTVYYKKNVMKKTPGE